MEGNYVAGTNRIFLPTGVVKQHRIITYGVSPNRLNPLAGTAHDAVFNTWRRFSKQVLYFAPPMIAAYYVMDWAIHQYALLPLFCSVRDIPS